MQRQPSSQRLTAFRCHSSSTKLVNATSVSRPQSIAIVHAEEHCNVEIVAQDRSWFHASKFFQDVIPQIEFDCLNQLDIDQWDVDYRVSCLILLKKKTCCVTSSWRYRTIDWWQLAHARSCCRYCKRRTAHNIRLNQIFCATIADVICSVYYT